jgi:hypothetical protein
MVKKIFPIKHIKVNQMKLLLQAFLFPAIRKQLPAQWYGAMVKKEHY